MFCIVSSKYWQCSVNLRKVESSNILASSLTHSMPEAFDNKCTAVFRAIVKKRKALEYKLRRKVKEKVDFLNYIQVCLVLLPVMIASLSILDFAIG